MIVPTVGRVVWFFKSADVGVDEQPQAAIICYVHNDRLINIALFEPSGGIGSAQSVFLHQDGDGIPHGPHCEWMPYQIATAKAVPQTVSNAPPNQGVPQS